MTFHMKCLPDREMGDFIFSLFVHLHFLNILKEWSLVCSGSIIHETWRSMWTWQPECSLMDGETKRGTYRQWNIVQP